VRDVKLVARGEGDVWRISVKPSDGPAVIKSLPSGAAVQMDWGGGLVWARVPSGTDVRKGLRGIEGHATLVRADEATKGRLGVFRRSSPPLPPSRARPARQVRPRTDISTPDAWDDGQTCRPTSPSSSCATRMTKRSNKVLRTCVHCGFCTATCPTYQVLGDELDSPRGRIYLIKDMLENGRPADKEDGQAHRPLPVVPRLHVDVPVGRALHAPGRPCPRIHRTDLYAALPERVLRWLLAQIIPYPTASALPCSALKFAKPFARCPAGPAEGDGGTGAQ
jgi:ferredoxin